MNESEDKNSSFIRGFIRDIIGCLFSPRSTFNRIIEKSSLKKAIILILVIAIVAAWASFNYTSNLPLDSNQDQPPRQGSLLSPGQFTQMAMIMSAMMALIGIFGTWLISSSLVHGFSRLLGGKGSFGSIITLTGYASAPLLIQHVIRLADSFTVSQETLQLTATLQISTNALLNSIIIAAMDTFTIFRIWSMVLLIIATSKNYKISTAKSTVATVLSFIGVVLVSAFLPLR